MKRLFEIPNLILGTFLNRPNRFVAEIEYDGEKTTAHVHDPGRLKELLIPGAELLMIKGKESAKHPFYIKAVKSKKEWVLIDSSLQRKISEKLFPIMDEFKNVKEIRAEVKLKNSKSRIDWMINGVPLENKGVSLVIDGIALFPDAPTERGTRHVKEIIKHNGMILFIIFKKANIFSPNFNMDPKFSNILSVARAKGVTILCAQIFFDGKSVYYCGKVPLSDF
ncbi:MAG: DNA/RNA nuclease SfsA [archaeon]|nr:DNA/RNA nuclease SfsA [archaeon]